MQKNCMAVELELVLHAQALSRKGGGDQTAHRKQLNLLFEYSFVTGYNSTLKL